MPPLAALIKSLGTPDVNDELKQKIVDGVLEIAGDASVDELAQAENEELLGLIKLRTKNETVETRASSNGRGPSERVFFLDVSGGRLESVDPDGSERRVIIDGLGPTVATRREVTP